jgi:hypothetical protein
MSAPEHRAFMKALVPDLVIVHELLTRSAFCYNGSSVMDVTRFLFGSDANVELLLHLEDGWTQKRLVVNFVKGIRAIGD